MRDMTNAELIAMLWLEENSEMPPLMLESDLRSMHNRGLLDHAFNPTMRCLSDRGKEILAHIRTEAASKFDTLIKP
jgi:hypothetical protein